MPSPSRPSPMPAAFALALLTLTPLPGRSAPAALAAEDSSTATLPEVLVRSPSATTEGSTESGYRNRTATVGPLGKGSLQDTPYSINVTSGELIEHRNAHTVSDALRTNPTVATLMEPSGYSTLSRVMIRGFTAADQSDMRDGLVDRSFTYVPLENVERIEVLNGLSGFLYGFSALGGALNYISKQPTEQPFTSLSAGNYGGGINYLHADSGGPIDADGRWGYRLNAYGEDGSTYIEDSDQRRGLLSGVLQYRLTPDTLIKIDAWQQRLSMEGLQTYINVNPAAGIRVPSASRYDATTQYGQDWTYNTSEKTLLGVALESRLNETFSLRTAYRYGEMWRDYLYVGATLTDNAGHYTEKATGTTGQVERTHSTYALVDADFALGAVTHKLTVGYSGTSYLYSRGDDVSKLLGLSDIDDPVDYADPDLTIGPTNVWYAQDYRNWVLGDRLTFDDAWSALVGINRASLKLHRWGSGSALAARDYAQDAVTPSVAVMYKPRPDVTTYASYMEGLVNGGSAPRTAANAYEILDPSVSKQYEVGVKATLGHMDLTAALFRIEQVNEYTDPSDNVYKQDGLQVNQGLEVMATGKLLERLTLVGGFTLLDAEVRKAAKQSLEGKTPVNVPEQQARLYLEYALPRPLGLTLTAGANYFGARQVDAANTDELDAATTVDLGLRYQTRLNGHGLTLGLNVSNLFDQAYWSYYRSGDGLLLGAPRLFALNAKLDL